MRFRAIKAPEPNLGNEWDLVDGWNDDTVVATVRRSGRGEDPEGFTWGLNDGRDVSGWKSTAQEALEAAYNAI
jgi:hypothetical protein